jgi:hypothetical protein
MNEEVSYPAPAQGEAPMGAHLSRDELAAGLDEILRSPGDRGVLEAVVIRPETNARESLQRCELSPERGVHGDNWAQGCWMTLPDGRPHPDVQVTLMNARTIALIAQDEARWALAGDNLYVDLDLSSANLPPGTRLAIARRSSRSPRCPTMAARSSPRGSASRRRVSSTPARASACTCAGSTPGLSKRA